MTAKTVHNLILCLCGFFMCLSMNAQAKDLRIGFSLTKPPYVFAEDKRGLEVDLVTQAFRQVGYEVTPVFYPPKRLPYTVKSGALDGAAGVAKNIDGDVYFSDELITYQNYAISLKRNKLVLRAVGDLVSHRVVAFQNAQIFLGQEFMEMTQRNETYNEVANQELQIKLLAAGRTEFVIADWRIFLFFKEKYESQGGPSFDVSFHKVFDPTPRYLILNDPELLERFNAGLAYLHESGEFDRIVKSYIRQSETPNGY